MNSEYQTPQSRPSYMYLFFLKKTIKYSRPELYANPTLFSPVLCYKHFISMNLDEYLAKLWFSTKKEWSPKIPLNPKVQYFPNILTEFNFATVTTLYIFQKIIDCKLHLLWWLHHELVSSANTLVLIVQLNLMTLLLRINFGHWNISYVGEILSHQMKGYKQISAK